MGYRPLNRAEGKEDLEVVMEKKKKEITPKQARWRRRLWIIFAFFMLFFWPFVGGISLIVFTGVEVFRYGTIDVSAFQIGWILGILNFLWIMFTKPKKYFRLEVGEEKYQKMMKEVKERNKKNKPLYEERSLSDPSNPVGYYNPISPRYIGRR